MARELETHLDLIPYPHVATDQPVAIVHHDPVVVCLRSKPKHYLLGPVHSLGPVSVYQSLREGLLDQLRFDLLVAHEYLHLGPEEQDRAVRLIRRISTVKMINK